MLQKLRETVTNIGKRAATGVAKLRFPIFEPTLARKAYERVEEKPMPGIITEGGDLDITYGDWVRGLPDASDKVFSTIGGYVTESVIPGISDFIRTSGQVFGEGLAYRFDSNVRGQVQQAIKRGDPETVEKILPTISRVTWQDMAKKTGAAGLETAIFKSIPAAMRMKLAPRGGAGALQGIGRAISEGLVKDSTKEEIIENAKKYAPIGAGVSIVAPYLMKVLGSPIKDAPSQVKNQATRFASELKDQVPIGIRYKYPKMFEPGLKSAQIKGRERMEMAKKAADKLFSRELRSLSTPGKIEHATYNLPGAKIRPTLVTKKAPDGSTYKVTEQRFNFDAGDYTNKGLKNSYTKFQSPTSQALWQDNLDITKGKMGIVSRRLYYPSQEAIGNEAMFKKHYAQKMIDINKKLGVKPSLDFGKKTKQVLEAIPNRDLKTLSTQELIKKYGDLRAFRDITPKHITAAKEYRPLLDELRVNANKMRKLLGEKEIGELDRYAPWLQKVNEWDKIIRTDPKTNAMLVRDFQAAKKVINPHAKHRMSEGLKNPEENFFALYDRYVSATGRDIYFNPAIRQLNAEIKALREVAPKSADFWEEQVKAGMVGTYGHPWLEKLAQIRAQAAIPGNILWAHTVQPSSMALTVKDRGYKNTLGGAMEYYRDAKTRRWVSQLAATKIKDAKGHSTIMSGSVGNQEGLVWRPFSRKWSDFAGTPITAIEKQLTGMSAAAGKIHGTKLGFSGQDLKIYASMAADMSQSMYNAGSRPLILNNPGFRFVFPFKTFVMEAQTHALELAGGAKAPISGSVANKIGHRLSNGIQLTTAAYLLNKYNEHLRGTPVYTPGSFINFSEAGEYAIEKLAGKNIGRFSGRSPIAPFQDYETFLSAAEEIKDVSRKLEIEAHDNMIDLGRALGEYAVSGDLRNFRQQLIYWTMGGFGFAGANQVNKTIDGVIAAQREEVRDRAGAHMFKIEGLEKLESVLFGPWTTKSALEYFKENEKLIEARKEQTQLKTDETTLARHYLRKIKDMDQEDKENFWNSVNQEAPHIAEEMERLAKIKEKDLTAIDKRLLNLNVKNWIRAREITRILKEMPEKERAQQYIKWKETGVISTEVERQIITLFEMTL